MAQGMNNVKDRFLQEGQFDEWKSPDLATTLNIQDSKFIQESN